MKYDGIRNLKVKIKTKMENVEYKTKDKISINEL